MYESTRELDSLICTHTHTQRDIVYVCLPAFINDEMKTGICMILIKDKEKSIFVSNCAIINQAKNLAKTKKNVARKQHILKQRSKDRTTFFSPFFYFLPPLLLGPHLRYGCSKVINVMERWDTS